MPTPENTSTPSKIDVVSYYANGENTEFRKMQLAEFYGPIYAYSKLNTEGYNIWRSAKLQDINKEIIARFRKNNEEVIRILATKLHPG